MGLLVEGPPFQRFSHHFSLWMMGVERYFLNICFKHRRLGYLFIKFRGCSRRHDMSPFSIFTCHLVFNGFSEVFKLGDVSNTTISNTKRRIQWKDERRTSGFLAGMNHRNLWIEQVWWLSEWNFPCFFSILIHQELEEKKTTWTHFC